MRWYFTDKPFLEHPTVFCSRNWESEKPWDSIFGEVAGAPRQWVNGKPPPAAGCDGPCGDDDDWAPEFDVACTPQTLWYVHETTIEVEVLIDGLVATGQRLPPTISVEVLIDALVGIGEPYAGEIATEVEITGEVGLGTGYGGTLSVETELTATVDLESGDPSPEDPCCEGMNKSVFTATVIGVSGMCSPINGTVVTLSYDSGAGYWKGSSPYTGGTLYITFKCDAGTGTFKANASCSGYLAPATTATDTDCDTPNIQFAMVAAAFCGLTCNITLEVV